MILKVTSFCITQNFLGSELFSHYTEQFWKWPPQGVHVPWCADQKKTAYLLHFFQQVLNEGGTRSHCYLHLVSSIQDLHTTVIMRLKPVNGVKKTINGSLKITLKILTLNSRKCHISNAYCKLAKDLIVFIHHIVQPGFSFQTNNPATMPLF